MKATLVLENGTAFSGKSFGAPGLITGEVVFNTSLSGYQEIFTDPSYAGQIVVMTCPMIGNYGVNPEDLESERPQVAGVIVREYSDFHSNYRASQSLGSWLTRHGVAAIEEVDTRMLTRMLRSEGAMRGLLSTDPDSPDVFLKRVRESPSMTGLNLAGIVTCKEPYEWREVDRTPFALKSKNSSGKNGRRFKVVAYDFGIKQNILRRLVTYGCDVTVVPADFSARSVLNLDPDGIFLSNGPGDPAAVASAIANIKLLIGRKPIFGICLGHQLLALALGAKTFKLKFGHRGANHPVKNLLTEQIEITSQNHGFAVDQDSLDPASIEITHSNLNDGTNEGFRHRQFPLFSVQYHPEASPGPHDSDYLFRDFAVMMETRLPASDIP